MKYKGKECNVVLYFKKDPVGDYRYSHVMLAEPTFSSMRGGEKRVNSLRVVTGGNEGICLDYPICMFSSNLRDLEKGRRVDFREISSYQFSKDDGIFVFINSDLEKFCHEILLQSPSYNPFNVNSLAYSVMEYGDMLGQKINNIQKTNKGFSAIPNEKNFGDIKPNTEMITYQLNPKKVKAEAGVGSVANATKYPPQVEKKVDEKSDSQRSESFAISNIDPAKVKEAVRRKVIAQDGTIDAVVNNIYFNQLFIDSGDIEAMRNKANILLDGPTGTGKTFILESVAKEVGLPIVVTAITNYTSVGYKGTNLDKILVSLLEKADGNLELAERGIVALDEFDKLGGFADNDISMRKAVQQELLSFIGGNKYLVEYGGREYSFDTSKLTIIGMGAFTKLRENKISENEKKYKPAMGFSSSVADNCERKYSITKDDYIDQGLERELVGRFTCLAYTNDLGIEDLERILTESTTSPLKGLILAGELSGCKVVFPPEIIHEIAKRAFDTNTGARGLSEIVQSLRNVVANDIISCQNRELIINTEHLDAINKVHERTYHARKEY